MRFANIALGVALALAPQSGLAGPIPTPALSPQDAGCAMFKGLTPDEFQATFANVKTVAEHMANDPKTDPATAATIKNNLEKAQSVTPEELQAKFEKDCPVPEAPELPQAGELPKPDELPKAGELPKTGGLPQTRDIIPGGSNLPVDPLREVPPPPQVPDVPGAPNVPEDPKFPELPGAPNVPEVPNVSGITRRVVGGLAVTVGQIATAITSGAAVTVDYTVSVVVIATVEWVIE